MKGRARSGLDFFWYAPSACCTRAACFCRGKPARWKRAYYGLRIDQVAEFLCPVLIQTLQNDILLDGRIARAARQQNLA